jgi:hypothetical protein
VTREELIAVIAEILAIHACPCCVAALPGRADTIAAACDAYAADQIARAVAGPLPGTTP